MAVANQNKESRLLFLALKNLQFVPGLAATKHTPMLYA